MALLESYLTQNSSLKSNQNSRDNMHQNILINSLKESFISIWRNKSLFLLLFVLQILFFAVFSYTNFKYQTRILENAQAITDYLEKQQLDDAAFASNLLEQKNILGDDPLWISRHFNEIVKSVRLYLINIIVLLILFMSLAWTITFRLIYEKKFNAKAIKFFIIKFFLKCLVVIFFYLALIFSFFYSLFNISLTEFAAQGLNLLKQYIPFLVFSLVLIYFMFISISLLYSTELKNLVQKTLTVGIKKIHYVMAAYFINLILFGVSITLLYYFIDDNLFILSLSVLMFTFSFVFGRILMVNVVEKLEN